MSDVAQGPEGGWRLEYPPELPISAHAAEIKRLLLSHQVLVVAGETGSGKTTQLPKMCLDAGLGRAGRIAHTQPRRLAARAVATRVAEELGVALGAEVGYAVRFSERTSERTVLKVVTDGLLLTEVRSDRWLERYEVVIVDEAHERSLNVDFLLGYLKRVAARRPELKIIITSATIDVASFAAHFDAPVVEVSGRSYPVETIYVEGDEPVEEKLLRCLGEIEQLSRRRPPAARDVLVFQSGEREIFDTAKVLRAELGERWEILPLYARLSARDQQRVFKPGSVPRVVLATNVAETSLTVPNIGYVVDPGFARVSRYSYRSKLQRLPVEPISRASADQRQGRCGRVAPGVCFRLYGEQDYLSRPEFTDAEIKRTNLAQVVLQMRALGLGAVGRFPFLEPPDPRAVRDAERLLGELGALAGSGLSDTGAVMSRLPVDPRLARMLVAAEASRCLTELLVIVSALAIQDPRERPLDRQGSADRAHAAFYDPRSDFLAFVNLWRWYLEARQNLTRSALVRELGKRFLSPARMREWHELHRQLLLAVRHLGFRPNAEPADYAAVHRAVLAGSLSLIGQHDEKGNYLGPRNLKFRIFPGSALADATPRWLVAGEIAETRRVYARAVARVEARWIEEVGAHLVKRQHADPHWSARRGEVMAYETVTLYGLRLAERRPVSYSRIDPALCRELFLLDGLVRGGIQERFDFLDHNAALVREILDREAKSRRRDLLVAEAGHADLYDARLPAEVNSVATLRRWLRSATEAERARLWFEQADLAEITDVEVRPQDFPANLELNGMTLAVRYRFAPGEPDDGVTVEVPVGLVGALVAEQLEWSVPGFFPLVAEQWLRSLPKSKRRLLAPVPDTLAEILPLLLHPRRYRRGKLLPALAEVVRDARGVALGADDWHRERVDPHLLVNVRVVDGRGKTLAQGRDAAELQARFREALNARMDAGLGADVEANGLTEFPGRELAESLSVRDDRGVALVYPGLVDEGVSVGVRLFADPRARDRASRDGYARLALLAVPQTARYLKRQLDSERELGLHYAALGSAATLADELTRASAWFCFFDGRELPRTAEAFADRIRAGKGELAEVFTEVTASLRIILARRFELVRSFEDYRSPAYGDAVADVAAQVDRLVPADVLTRTPRAYLDEIPRYLEAAAYRLRHLQGKVTRDAELTGVVHGLTRRLDSVADQPSAPAAEVTRLRFDLEELRVRLFAEPLAARRTGGRKVSVKRVDRDLAERERALGLR